MRTTGKSHLRKILQFSIVDILDFRFRGQFDQKYFALKKIRFLSLTYL